MTPIQHLTLDNLTQKEVDIIVAGLLLLKNKAVNDPMENAITPILKLIRDLKPYTSAFKDGIDVELDEYHKQLEDVDL